MLLLLQCFGLFVFWGYFCFVALGLFFFSMQDGNVIHVANQSFFDKKRSLRRLYMELGGIRFQGESVAFLTALHSLLSLILPSKINGIRRKTDPIQGKIKERNKKQTKQSEKKSIYKRNSAISLLLPPA